MTTGGGDPVLRADLIDAVLDDAVANGSIPGVVALVADRSRVLYRHAGGVADLRNGRPMRTDQVFRIASMTKLATTLVAFQLIDEGRLDLDADVASLAPGFGDLAVLTGFDDEGAPVLEPQRARATVASLLTHTSGLAYDTWSPDLDRYLTVRGRPRLGSGLRDALAMPLVAQPRTSFHYGTSMDWLGVAMEAITGSPIAELFRTRLFAPLGMRDTTVWARSDARLGARLAAVHVRGATGWTATDADYWAPEVRRPEFLPAGHCLYATADDFMRLQQVALGDGSLDGIRIGPSHLVDELYVDHIGDLDVGVIPTAAAGASRDIDLRGWGWSLGLLLSRAERPGMRSSGSAGWAGGFNTFYWMDRGRGITAALHTATLPFWDDAVMATVDAFESAVGRAVPPGAD